MPQTKQSHIRLIFYGVNRDKDLFRLSISRTGLKRMCQSLQWRSSNPLANSKTDEVTKDFKRAFPTQGKLGELLDWIWQHSYTQDVITNAGGKLLKIAHFGSYDYKEIADNPIDKMLG